MKMAFDMSSVMWTALRVGIDKDGVMVQHNGKMVQVNTAAYGYENAVNMMKAALDDFGLAPKDMILVFEGQDSKRRRCMIDPSYKGNRDSDKPPEMYLHFNELKEQLKSVWRNLGAIAVTQAFAEGDDTLAWLAENTEEDLVIVTNDNDLIVLNCVNKSGAKVQVRVNREVGKNKYGDFDLALVRLYKATVGDSSDGIKGCPGFGPTAFLNVNGRYGDDGCFELLGLIEQGKRDELAQVAKDNSCKYLNKIVEEWETTARSLKLVTLRPEWVDTLRHPLVWEPGVALADCPDERLKHWRGQAVLVTAENYEQMLRYLKARLPENDEVGFDIETSTPPESDDWLAAQDNPEGVDVFGSYLVGFSLTFGKNNEKTLYVSVKHADTNNITMTQARVMIEACFGKKIIIQNTAFELCVLANAEDEDGSKWVDHWAEAGEMGYIPGVLDTKMEASYVDENFGTGLKDRSFMHLGYKQQTFKETTELTGPVGTLFPGGTQLKLVDGVETRRYKMHELPATHVFGYGADDTICTMALHNFYKLHMQLEHHWEVYKDVEIDSAYMHADQFMAGLTYSMAKSKTLEAEDKVTYDAAWAKLRAYLMGKGWEGTVPPTYGPDISAKEIKEAYAIVMGLNLDDEEDDEDEEGQEAPKQELADPVLKTRVRTPAKLVALLQAEGHDEFAAMLQGCLDGQHEAFTAYVRRRFTGEPKFKSSNKQMTKLLYETMGLPIRVRGKPTAKMIEKGIREGNPKGDALAIAYAMRDADDELKQVLEAIKLMQMVKTRMSLYYTKYPYFVHWKDGKIHSSHNQCGTNTRRASSSKPNMQQMPKHPKIEGQPARFREVIVPHRPGAVVVSMDFAAQELRVIADYSQDANMLACFVGDKLKDMHILTAVGILQEENIGNWSYETFVEAYNDRNHPDYKFCKEYRALGKKVNFTTEYGAAAPKLAMTLLVDEDKAQKYIDARESAFSGAKRWKQNVQEEAKTNGYVTTMLGARRHLAAALNSDDRYIASKADRQAVNFKIQSSSAEMTKKAEGRMWRSGIFRKFDAVCYGPIHDEIVASVMIEDLVEFLPLMHSCMVAPYAKMTVPIESSISFGPNFSMQIEIGDRATPEAVASGLEEMKKAIAKAMEQPAAVAA